MDPERHERVTELFLATYELAPPQRAAVLDRQCADDPSLRQEVEVLLGKHADPSSFLEDPALGPEFRMDRNFTVIDRDAQLLDTARLG